MQETSTVPKQRRQRSRPSIRLQVDKVNALIEPIVGTSPEAKADFLNIDYVTWWRLTKHPDHEPSNKVIAAILTAIPGAKFEDLHVLVAA